jgi:hypothetical protein
MKNVIDLNWEGVPYIRKARPDELDGEGNLIELAAKYPGLGAGQWKALRTPAGRAAASARWRALAESWTGDRRVAQATPSGHCPDAWAIADALSR